MFASIVIVILAILFGSLSILAQYTKDRERRKKIEGAVSIPAGLALFGALFWLMSHAHHLDDVGVSPLALWVALVSFLLIPAGTYLFSPAFKDAGEDDSLRPQNSTSQPPQSVPYPQRPVPSRSVVAVDDFIINGVVVDVMEDPQFLLE